MTDILLIGVDDFKALRQISPNINATDRILPFVHEAQTFDVKPFMGDAFYFDMVTNRNAAKYLELLDGTTYTDSLSNTIGFNGLKMAIAYYAFARFIMNQQVTVTTFGVNIKTNEYSQPADEKMIVRMNGSSRASAEAIMNDVRKYLDRTRDTDPTKYPLWRSGECAGGKSPSQPTVTGVSRI